MNTCHATSQFVTTLQYRAPFSKAVFQPAHKLMDILRKVIENYLLLILDISYDNVIHAIHQADCHDVACCSLEWLPWILNTYASGLP